MGLICIGDFKIRKVRITNTPIPPLNTPHLLLLSYNFLIVSKVTLSYIMIVDKTHMVMLSFVLSCIIVVLSWDDQGYIYTYDTITPKITIGQLHTQEKDIQVYTEQQIHSTYIYIEYKM